MSAAFHDYTSIPTSPDLSRLSPPGKLRTSSARPSGSRPYQCSPSHIELLPHTDSHSIPGGVNDSLITSPIPPRPSRLPKLSPGPDPKLNTPPHFAISHSYISYTPDQDVFRHPELLNHRPISHRPSHSPNPGHQVHSPSLLESSKLSSSSTRHVAINSHNARLKTSNQVFNNISDLAAHYGIPQFLPVAPRTTPRRINDSTEASSSTQTDDISVPPDFLNLCSNYLTMLSEKPTENGAADVQVEDTRPVEAVPDVDAEAIRSLLDVLSATPELQTSNDLNEYLTSPLIDSPLDDDLLRTPAMGTDVHADILTSPLMDYGNDSFGGEFPSLFEEFSHAMYQTQAKPPNVSPFPHQPDFNGMYRLDSPNTPMFDTPGSAPLDVAPRPKRKSNATGTRKNITVESLVPIDAPTQGRSYLTPSATSRKELPATFRRKRARTAGPGDEEDELVGEEASPTVSEQEQIESKRRQNTVAARRSRARKLEYLQELERKVEQYQTEVNLWKQRALTCQAVLRSHDVQCDQTKEQW